MLDKLQAAGYSCPYTSSWLVWVHIDNVSALSGAPAMNARGQLTFNGLPQVKHVAMMATWVKAGYFRNFGRRDEASARFHNGECAMITTDSREATDFRDDLGVELGVTALPFHEDVYGGRQHTLADGASLWSGNGHSPAGYKEAAEFVSFLLKPEMQIELVRTFGPLPLTAAARSQLADIAPCGVFIVTVPTPIDQANRPDLTPLVKASETVGKAMQRGAVVIYESTVYPGCTEEVCVPVLEKFSDLKLIQTFFAVHSPERINPGDKVNTLTTIKKITSGSTPDVAVAVDALYGQIIKGGAWKASSIKVAEAAKVIENSQRDLNFAFVNELSVIFERLGIDTLEVLEASGSKWNFLPFRPGMVGGHCVRSSSKPSWPRWLTGLMWKPISQPVFQDKKLVNRIKNS